MESNVVCDECENFPSNKEMVDGVLKQLEENKEKAKKKILMFGDKAGKKIEKTERDVISVLTRQNKMATRSISGVIEKYQQQQNLPFYKTEGLNKLREHFAPYCVRDNSVFVFDVLKKCLCERFGCIAPESFLAPILQSEIVGNLKTMKEFILESCTKPNHTKVIVFISYFYSRQKGV